MFSERLEIRIISGEFGGRRLKGPKKSQEVRPALDRVKESLFAILHMDLPGKSVLDLCSGTGSLGLEALSRGARSAVFVEGDFDVARILQENINSLKVLDRAVVRKGRLPGILKTMEGERFDYIFFDPPYAANIVDSTLRMVNRKNLLQSDGCLIYKRDVKMPVFDTKYFTKERVHRVGETIIHFLGRKNDEGIQK